MPRRPRLSAEKGAAVSVESEREKWLLMVGVFQPEQYWLLGIILSQVLNKKKTLKSPGKK
jgi:hypothetical protein